MPKRVRQDKLMRTLFLTLGVLIVALVVALILMLATGGTQNIEEKQAQFIDSGKYIQGVSIAGVDVSGLTYARASENADIQSKAKQVVDGFTYSFAVDGKTYTYMAEELGITSDLQMVLEEALFFGNIGEGAQIRQQKTEAREYGFDFVLSPYAETEAVLQKLEDYKSEYDALPQDATLDISDDVIGIERFTYIDEVKGIDVDANQLASMIFANINKKDYSVIEAPAIITNPSIDVNTLKANTKLIGTYTSSFEGSLGHADRVTNIQLLADIVNGTVMLPGETWSINEAAGPRNEETAKTVGWAYASGISNGRYEDQVGGGVCQVSSTVYNAAIRGEMNIVFRRAHSWPSHYIPEGMDATISTGGPDLKIANPYDMNVYIAAYLHEDEKKITVEFYGPPLSHGYTIDFITNPTETIAAGESTYYYNATTDPDGNPIGEGKEKVWVKPRNGQVWEVYKQYLDDEGKVVESKFFSTNTYRAFPGVIYVNTPDPEQAPVAGVE